MRDESMALNDHGDIPAHVAVSRDANDRASEAVDRYPTRLRAMTTLPMSDLEAARPSSNGPLTRPAMLG